MNKDISAVAFSTIEQLNLQSKVRQVRVFRSNADNR